MMKADVFQHFGGGERPHFKVAEVLGCTPEAILMWPDDEPIPEAPAMKLHVITDGKLRADVELYARMRVQQMKRRRRRKAAKERAEA